ncbi:hypothetical protein TRFO_06738 [Tritrichomonas foetus]|uniref:Uncharacterized protein n=1 Tax=Tritrichomonas foetus TaxID=1144522 RepID=A0A1J4JWF2_9EUKA|nr:hypothetical protein TRFO_06738 [Tritrichomonas foetus]|eukprot:OHT03473.1 hypothetical protein TRFO_06738 [Tritrichomonas foetus]
MNENLLDQDSGEQKLSVKTTGTITPVTILQLLKAKRESSKSSTLIIDEIPRKEVSIIGKIISIREDSISLFYEINDGTGTFSVQIIQPSDERNEPPLSLNTYVYVVGRVSVTSHEEKNEPLPIIMAYHVKEITEFDQIPFHMIQALLVHLKVTKVSPVTSQTSQAGIHSSDISEPDEALYRVKKLTTSYSPKRNNSSSLSPEQKIEKIKISIVKLLQNCDENNGMNQKEIVQALSNFYSVEDILCSIDSLNYTGEIVNTISEDHYAVA